MSDPQQVLDASRALLDKHKDEDIQERIGRAQQVAKHARELVDKRDEEEKGAELLKVLPQGEGSGLDADLLDGLHANEIIAKSRTSGGASGSVSESVKAHRQNHVKGGGDAFNGATDELSFRVEIVDALPEKAKGRMVFLNTDEHPYICIDV